MQNVVLVLEVCTVNKVTTQMEVAIAHRHKATKAENHKHRSQTEGKHSERAPGLRILLPRDPTSAGDLTPEPQLPPDRRGEAGHSACEATQGMSAGRHIKSPACLAGPMPSSDPAVELQNLLYLL